MQDIEYEVNNYFLLKDESLRNKIIKHVKLKKSVYSILNSVALDI